MQRLYIKIDYIQQCNKKNNIQQADTGICKRKQPEFSFFPVLQNDKNIFYYLSQYLLFAFTINDRLMPPHTIRQCNSYTTAGFHPLYTTQDQFFFFSPPEPSPPGKLVKEGRHSLIHACRIQPLKKHHSEPVFSLLSYTGSLTCRHNSGALHFVAKSVPVGGVRLKKEIFCSLPEQFIVIIFIYMQHFFASPAFLMKDCSMTRALDKFDLEVPTAMFSWLAISWCVKPSITYILKTTR